MPRARSCERVPVPPLDGRAGRGRAGALRGPQPQIPPMYSALKREGQPLYKLARRESPSSAPAAGIEVSHRSNCSRSSPGASSSSALLLQGHLRPHAGGRHRRRLGTVGHVSSLRRDYVEPFEGEAMHTLESLAQMRARGDWPALLPADRAVPHLPAVQLRGPRKRGPASGPAPCAQPAGRRPAAGACAAL